MSAGGSVGWKYQTFEKLKEKIEEKGFLTKQLAVAYIKRRGYGHEVAEDIIATMVMTEEIELIPDPAKPKDFILIKYGTKELWKESEQLKKVLK